MSDIASLIEKLEGAEGGSRELDALVWLATGSRDHIASFTLPPFTTSLDAALALASRVLPGSGANINTFTNTVTFARSLVHMSAETTKAATPALALCAAILKAKEPTQ